jgi:hypothetical protein
MQPRHRANLHRRYPPSDGSGALPRFRVVADTGKPPAQLDRSRQLTFLIEDGADRSSIGLGDDEHPQTMAIRTSSGKRSKSAMCRLKHGGNKHHRTVTRK